MSSRYTIHCVRKSNIAEHSCITIEQDDSDLPPLRDGCIRARSTLVSLTANNMSYAHAGTLLHWWDAYPAPSADQLIYGIVPVWGYAEVVESKISVLKPGHLIWGFWPSHDMPVVLRLERDDDIPTHWIEVSKHRSRMMNLYNRYTEAPQFSRLARLSASELEKLAWQTVLAPVRGAGGALNRYVFGETAIHPCGTLEWSAEDADLSQAVVVSLSASGKTARAFADALIHDRKPNSGPLGLLAITANIEGELIPKASFSTSVTSYSAAPSPETLKWITQLQPRKIVVVDFGSRGDSLEVLMSALRAHSSSVQMVIIGVGREAKAMLPEELTALREKQAETPDRVQMNASGIYDKAIQLLGKKCFFEEQHCSLEQYLERGGPDGLCLQWGDGIAGDNGIEGVGRSSVNRKWLLEVRWSSGCSTS